ncbi:MAG: hypothetical protein J7497_14600, partial [Chitinophagaceae bacterium]|nr:hypothetical protein [Chitinophagaceae bacterium]
EYQKLIWNRKFNKDFKDENYQIYDYPLEVILAYDNAYNRYKLKPLDVKVDLFRVMKRIYYVDDFDYLGWKKYAGKGVVIHDVPGDHKTFLMPPNNKELMKLIAEAINNIKKI